MTISRKHFLRAAGLTGAAVALGTSHGFARQHSTQSAVRFSMGIASYTFRRFTVDEVIAYCKKLDLKGVSLKEMHLPLTADADLIRSTARKIRDAGLMFTSAGVIYMNNEAEVDRAFVYAQTAGISCIVGVPRHELLSHVEAKVKEFNIRVAIHNHGPEDRVYPSVHTVNEKIASLDSRIGFCIDVGHVARLNEDPAEMIRTYHSRMYEVHLKDVDESGNTIEAGRGRINLPAVLNELISVGYAGPVSFEFEKDEREPLSGVSESVGYIRGLLACI